jgi:addiction module RelE/StbE family toxin
VLVLRWREEALEDLAEIIDYIDARDSAAADRLHADIVATAEQFAERPFLYRPGRVPGTREAVVRPNYLIVYQVGEIFIDVLRVLHTARQYP